MLLDINRDFLQSTTFDIKVYGCDFDTINGKEHLDWSFHTYFSNPQLGCPDSETGRIIDSECAQGKLWKETGVCSNEYYRYNNPRDCLCNCVYSSEVFAENTLDLVGVEGSIKFGNSEIDTNKCNLRFGEGILNFDSGSVRYIAEPVGEENKNEFLIQEVSDTEDKYEFLATTQSNFIQPTEEDKCTLKDNLEMIRKALTFLVENEGLSEDGCPNYLWGYRLPKESDFDSIAKYEEWLEIKERVTKCRLMETILNLKDPRGEVIGLTKAKDNHCSLGGDLFVEDASYRICPENSDYPCFLSSYSVRGEELWNQIKSTDPGVYYGERIIDDTLWPLYEEYYNLRLDKANNNYGRMWCKLVSDGIIKWQDEFEGIKCSKSAMIEGAKTRTGGGEDGRGWKMHFTTDYNNYLDTIPKEPGSLSQNETFRDYLDLVFKSRYRYYFPFSTDNYGYDSLYEEVKDYYKFKSFHFAEDELYFENFADPISPGYCLGMSLSVGRFFKLADFVGLSTNCENLNWGELFSDFVYVDLNNGRNYINSTNLYQSSKECLGDYSNNIYMPIRKYQLSQIHSTQRLDEDYWRKVTSLSTNLKFQDEVFFEYHKNLIEGDLKSVALQGFLWNDTVNSFVTLGAHAIMPFEMEYPITLNTYDSNFPFQEEIVYDRFTAKNHGDLFTSFWHSKSFSPLDYKINNYKVVIGREIRGSFFPVYQDNCRYPSICASSDNGGKSLYPYAKTCIVCDEGFGGKVGLNLYNCPESEGKEENICWQEDFSTRIEDYADLGSGCYHREEIPARDPEITTPPFDIDNVDYSTPEFFYCPSHAHKEHYKIDSTGIFYDYVEDWNFLPGIGGKDWKYRCYLYECQKVNGDTCTKQIC